MNACKLIFGSLLLLSFASAAISPQEAKEHPLLSQLNNFEIVRPYHVESNVDGHPTRMAGVTDKHGHAVHAQSAKFALNALGKDLVLNLRLNEELLSENYVELADGEVYQHGAENCYYMGEVEGHPDSYIALQTCDSGLDGSINLQGLTIVIEPASKHNLQGKTHHTLTQGVAHLDEHIVYLHSEVKNLPEFTCGVTGDHTHSHSVLNMDFSHLSLMQNNNGIRTEVGSVNQQNTITEEQSSNRKLLQTTTTYYVEIFVVSDVTQTRAKGGTASSANRAALTHVNAISVIYAKISSPRIRIGAVGLEAWVSRPPTGIGSPTTTFSGDTYLSQFSQYITNTIRPRYPNDDALLLTAVDVSGPAGLAYVGGVCSSRGQGILRDESSRRVGTTYMVWTQEVMAHELGHNLGAQHDAYGNACVGHGYMMQPSIPFKSGPVSTTPWSTCTISYFRNKFQSLGTASCLRNIPRTTTYFTKSVEAPSVCGDGVVTGTEQCEPSVSLLCDPSTCKFREGYQCTTGGCCDVTRGVFKSVGAVCRNTLQECDVPEYCTGDSAECPVDTSKQDGTKCQAAGQDAVCHEGVCVGFDGQCRDNFAEFSSIGTWVKSGSSCYTSNGVVDECKALYCQVSGTPACYYLNVTDDAGLNSLVQVLDGTPCAEGAKMCMAGECVARVMENACTADYCNGHGACAQDGSCVCDPGFAGTRCEKKARCEVCCASLGRQDCSLSSGMCGACLPGRASPFPLSSPNANCSWGADRAENVDSSANTVASSARLAFDSFPYTAWTADLKVENGSATEDAYLEATFAVPFVLQAYQISSANNFPYKDPTVWEVSGSLDGAAFTVLDTQSGIMFGERQQTMTFAISDNNVPFRIYRFTAIEIANPFVGHTVQVGELSFMKEYSQENVVCDKYDTAGAASSFGTLFTVLVLIVAALLF